MGSKTILCVVGTRPEAIKMAPVISAVKANRALECIVLATAQHREMLDQVFHTFGIEPDIDLNVMKANQGLPELTSRLLTGLDNVLVEFKPDVVLAQGDTTTVLAAAMSSFYRHIPFGHVEAGLRTGDISNPFPEEMNRVVTSRLTRWHFAPTDEARRHLLSEGALDSDIIVSGNTVIDALYSVEKLSQEIGVKLDDSKKLILVTAHRRENFGKPMEEICKAVRSIVDQNNDVQVLFPVHYNPNVREIVFKLLSNHSQIVLCDPLDYLPFVAAMRRSYFILSDSGGVQEEAPALGKPVLVLRNETERPEAVLAGVVRLVGPNYDTIVGESQKLLTNSAAYASMAKNVSPYGDGQASRRIIERLLADLA